jgi:hypothetical protein
MEDQLTYEERLKQQQATAKAAILAQCDLLGAAGVTFVAHASTGGARRHAPVFALREIRAISGEQLSLDTFGTKDIYVRVVSLRPLKIGDPKGKVWSAGLGFMLRKLTPLEEDKLSKTRR